jgi:hypothetical protein
LLPRSGFFRYDFHLAKIKGKRSTNVSARWEESFRKWRSVAIWYVYPKVQIVQSSKYISGYNGRNEINGIARDSLSRRTDLSGPTVTGVIDNRVNGASKNPLSGFVIQDGCIPEPFNPVINMMLLMQTIKSHALSILVSPRRGAFEVLASMKSFLLGPYAIGGALQRTSTYLIMSHDSNEITLTLKDGQIHLRAPKEGRSGRFQLITGLLKELFIFTGAKMGFSYFYGKTDSQYLRETTNQPSRSTSGGSHGSSSRWGQYEWRWYGIRRCYKSSRRGVYRLW